MKKLAKIYTAALSVLAVVGMIGYIVSVVVQVFSRTFLPWPSARASSYCWTTTRAWTSSTANSSPK